MKETISIVIARLQFIKSAIVSRVLKKNNEIGEIHGATRHSLEQL